MFKIPSTEINMLSFLSLKDHFVNSYFSICINLNKAFKFIFIEAFKESSFNILFLSASLPFIFKSSLFLQTLLLLLFNR